MESDSWLLMRSGALGDTVLSIQLMLRCPAVRAAGRMHLCANRRLAALGDANPAIEEISLADAQLDWLFTDSNTPPPDRLRAAIAGKNVVNLLHSRDAPRELRIAAVGPRRLFNLDPRPLPGAVRHIVDQWQSQLALQGMPFQTCPSKLHTSASLGLPAALRERGAAASETTAGCANPIFIHPGSGSPQKNWPLTNYIEIAHALRAAGRPVAFLLGEVEQEHWPCAHLVALRADFPTFVQPASHDLIAQLAAAALVIGNDSGPLHLAALLGAPTLSIFGPTDPRIWCPLGSACRVLSGNTEAGANWGLNAEQVVEVALKCWS